jgi:5-methylcytosine-specific restriction endonuclease McrA
MLDAEVLILNRVYLPIRVTTARRAFCLLYQGKAKAILPDYTTYEFDDWIERPSDGRESVGLLSRRVGIPRVIVLASFSGTPRHEVRFSRRNVFVRDGYRCQYCGHSRTSRELNLDHVVPLSHGGSSTWENVVCCCISCNRRKGNRTPESAGMQLRRPPRRPRWHPLHDGGRRRQYPDDWRQFVDASILEWAPEGAVSAEGN